MYDGAIRIKVNPMLEIDDYELEILNAHEKGQLKTVARKAEFFRRSTAIKETLFLQSMPDVHASIKEGVSEPLDTSARKLDW